MYISLPCVRINDCSVRFINYSLQEGNFTIPDQLKVTDDVIDLLISHYTVNTIWC